MSLIDELREMESRIVARLQELEPLVAEYDQLREEAERRGIKVESKRPAAPARRKKAPAPKRAKPPPPVTERQEQLLALVRAKPGITVAGAGRELGVDPTSLYRIVRRLESEGRLVKTGRLLQPPG